MKHLLFILIILAIAISSCNTKPSPKKQKAAKADSTEIIQRYYKNTKDVVEYKIPVLKGTNIKHGIQKRYYRHGSLYSAIAYKNGKRTGKAYTYYQAAVGVKPNVWKELMYVDNKLHGICKRYHKDGTLQAVYEYKNGNPAIGLKEYKPSGVLIKQPEIIVSTLQTGRGLYISAQLSDNNKKVDYYIGELSEYKYLPKGLKGLQVKNGMGEAILDGSIKKITITAVFTTRYRNSCLVSKTIYL